MIDSLGLFLDYLVIERAFSHNTIRAYSSIIKKLDSYCSSTSIDLIEVDYNLLKNYITKLSDKTISKKTISLHITVIKSFYRFLKKEGYITVNPTIKLEFPKLQQHLPVTLSTDEVNRILNSIDINKLGGKRMKAMIEIMFSSGIRISELLNIKINDLNIDKNTLFILGKGNKQLIVLFSNYAKQLIIDYLLSERPKLIADTNSPY
jgi:site-specific recombinase XerD